MTSRRAFIGGLAGTGLALSAAPACAADRPLSVRVRDGGRSRPISPYVYGDNAVGTLEGGRPASELAREARVTARRLGGNLMTTYNWGNNFTNAGRDWRHDSGPGLANMLGLAGEDLARPGAVIERMHETSLSMGAVSSVTLPLAGYVAADAKGDVAPGEAAPSARWTPVVWRDEAAAGDPIDPSVADIGHLLRRLQERFGSAGEQTGIRAYGLDNEPALWHETHPRITPRRVAPDAFIERSLKAARVIRAIDPDAWICGPSLWGATALLNFHGHPQWRGGRGRRNFVAAYLAAFRRASEEEGARLLDCLDVHWYPFHRDGDLLATEDPRLAAAQLAAPRTLSEDGFVENSWVGDMRRALRSGGLSLPILPSLQDQIDAHFPGTRLSVSEFNYGGPNALASGLAVADALGRYGREGVVMA
ncbi:MAG: glycoside hydrolase family 44 protein, partial [Caulobacterales bacterium]|nr:glycoside hydrolase family 44 protein [Caulobacterales bacterium]